MLTFRNCLEMEMQTTTLQKLERIKKIARRVTSEELIEEGFAALEAAGLDRERVEDAARELGLEGDDMALSVASARPSHYVANHSGCSDVGGIQATLAAMDGKIEEIRRTLLKQRTIQLDKEWYTIAEAAAATEFKPYTLRQCCNLGRIREEWTSKHHRTGEWRIRREAIEQIRNHGLPPVT
jgi:hypothetical protein